ncbi:hypothetical protein AAG570_005920 [Ranatra chinensis]|uniref:Uncharacterized protein n=1 Tax=Ranatra chinensis TaxID=642074 RepID=A0ABD0XZ55_9HEMI
MERRLPRGIRMTAEGRKRCILRQEDLNHKSLSSASAAVGLYCDYPQSFEAEDGVGGRYVRFAILLLRKLSKRLRTTRKVSPRKGDYRDTILNRDTYSSCPGVLPGRVRSGWEGRPRVKRGGRTEGRDPRPDPVQRLCDDWDAASRRGSQQPVYYYERTGAGGAAFGGPGGGPAQRGNDTGPPPTIPFLHISPTSRLPTG